MSVNSAQGVSGLNAFAGAVDRTGAGVSRSVASIDRSIGGLSRSMSNMNTRGMTSLTLGALRAGTAINQLQGIALAAGVAVGGLFPAAVAASMVRTVDGAHRLSNQLRTVTTNANDLKDTQQALYEVAQRSRSSFDGTVTIYARTARAVEHLNMKQKDLLRMTETVQKAFAVGGATTAEAWGGAVQLSQGIASNRFSGDEFRSVAENAPVLLRGMAKNLGVTIGKLREMAHAGQLTADVVTRAIIGASQEIDEAFAKTTSTIEQAWTLVGNAVTKYAMDSEKASAGSLAIVGGLNLMADNISGLVDIVVALGAVLTATFAARRMQAVTGWVSGLKAARIETLALAQSNQFLAQAQMQAARADFLQKRLAFNAALNAGTLSAKQLERQKKALAASSTTYRNATQASTAATTQLSAAQRAASASGMTMAAAGRAVSAAWSFIGGPFGAAMIALGGVMYLQSQRAAEAEARSSHYADAIKKAGENSTGASPGIKQVAADLFSVGAGATAAARQVTLAEAKVRELGALREMFVALEQAGIRGGWGFRHMYVELEALYQQFRAGAISAEEFASKTDDIARNAPGALQQFIADMQKSANEADAARGEIVGVAEQIEKLDGKEAKVTITIGTRTIELTDGGVAAKGDRPGASAMDKAAEDMRQNMLLYSRTGWDEIFKFPKENKSGGGGRSRRSADDRFDNSVQSIYDRIEALKVERETIGATFYEQTRRQEALKLEQEALKQAREEARRKGDADWQNAQISMKKREEIDKVTAALAAEADMTRLAVEAQQDFEEWLNVGRDATRGFIDDLLNGVSAGEAFANVLKKIGNQLIDLAMNDLFGKAGSGGHGLIGQLLNFGGFGGGASLSPAAWGVVSGGGMTGLFSDGGYTGDGGKYQPAGIVHAGEYVFSQDAVRRIGVDSLETLHDAASHGYAAGGLVDQVVASTSGLSDGGGATFAPVYHIDARGADVAAVARLEAGLAKTNREMEARIVQGVRKAQQSNVKLG